MFLREILHANFVVVVLVNNKKYTFNSTVNFEINLHEIKMQDTFSLTFLSSSHDRYHMFTHAFCTVYLEYAINIFQTPTQLPVI